MGEGKGKEESRLFKRGKGGGIEGVNRAASYKMAIVFPRYENDEERIKKPSRRRFQDLEKGAR